jgi:uncharacterized membrane protein
MRDDKRYRFATRDADGMRWHLARNCSIAPTQLGALYASLCLISTVIGIGFWLQGAPLVAPFAALELVVVGAAFLLYARHATDREHISLAPGQLEVEIERGGEVRRTVFTLQWVRVHVPPTPTSLIEVTGQGQTVRVGRHVRPELRAALAKELAGAVVAGRVRACL